jgi:methyl-accepting chemotaxis protein
MISRLTVSVLLKSVIVTLAAAVVVMVSLGAWNSWSRLAAVNRIATVVEATQQFFRAFYAVRLDRTLTGIELKSDMQSTTLNPLIRDARAIEVPSLKAALVALESVDLAERNFAMTSLDRSIKRLNELQPQTLAAFAQPKSARPPGLLDEYSKEATTIMEILDKLQPPLAKSVRLEDAYVDQLMELKQLSLAGRAPSSEAAIMVANALNGQAPPADALVKFNIFVGKTEGSWAALEELAAGLSLPAKFTEVQAKVNRELFAPDYVDLRLKLLKAAVAGEKPTMNVDDWGKLTTPKTMSLQQLAEVALDVAKDYAAEQRSIALSKLWFQLGLLMAALALATTMILVVSRRVIAPLQLIRQAMLRVATGDFNVVLRDLHRKDEIGQIAEAVGQMAERVRATIGEIRESAREVTNASTEISTSTTDLSQRTEEQAASLEQTSASMEEISATVKKNAENAQQANESARTTRVVADRGGEVVAKAVGAMAKIEESSRKISDIIGVIDEIARQTNLLALNAAVEAARAGEAGRGFAVVASEVRSLAQRSSQAAKDIKDLITNSNNQVKDGVDLVNQAGTALNEIMESIKSVAAIVSDIASASSEQATGLDQINKALTQMDEVTQQNSALVEENAATAKTLERQAKLMDEQVAFFQIDAVDASEDKKPAGARAERRAAANPGAAPAAKRPQAKRAA